MFAQAGIEVLRRLAPVALPRANDTGIDAAVLLFTLVISDVFRTAPSRFTHRRMGVWQVSLTAAFRRGQPTVGGSQRRRQR